MTVTTLRWAFVGLATLTGLSTTAGDQPYEWKAEFSDSQYLHGAITLLDDQFTLENCETVAQGVIKDNIKKQFVHVDMFPVEHYPPFNYMLMSHFSYDAWWKWLQIISPFPVARVVKIGSDAVFEHRDRSGSVTRKILSGSDPLQIVTSAGTVELLHFSYRRPPTVPGKIAEKADLEIFAKAQNSLDVAGAATVFAALRERIAMGASLLYLRNDVWFLDVSGFPLVYPFREDERAPTKEAFEQTLTFACGTKLDGSPHCFAYRGH